MTPSEHPVLAIALGVFGLLCLVFAIGTVVYEIVIAYGVHRSRDARLPTGNTSKAGTPKPRRVR